MLIDYVTDFESLSPYAKFVVENQGFRFFNKKTGEEKFKYEVFSIFEKNLHFNMELLSKCKHPIYERRSR